jgi:hypothetical protein
LVGLVSLNLRVGVALSCPDDFSAVSETVEVPASETDGSTNNSVDRDNFRLEPDLEKGLLSGVLGRHDEYERESVKRNWFAARAHLLYSS